MRTRNNIFLLFIAFLLHFGCANKVAPTGGTKDVTPPVLLTAEPENKTVNYSSDKIVLTFDEYIQLKDAPKQLVISPPIQPAPVIEIRKKSIIIETGDSLLPNTTYTINFGNSVVDNNESNPLPGFRYIFSTGNYLDSLSVKGVISDALSNKRQDAALALLYDATTHDSLLLKKTPDYFSRTNEAGKFEIRNIRPGTYRLFALVEKNNNYIFDQPDEFIGFASGSFQLKDSSEFEIVVYQQKLQKQSIKSSIIQEPGRLVTVFANPAGNLTWTFPYAKFDRVIPEYTTMKDTIYLYCFPPPADTLSVIWFDENIPIDTAKYQKPRGEVSSSATKKKSTGYNFYPAKGNNLTAETVPYVKWWAPVIQTDSSKIKFIKDSVIFPVTITFSDSLQTNMKFEGDWKEGLYTVQILPGAVTDIFNTSNDSINSSFTVPPERTKGSISFKIAVPDFGFSLLQLVNDKDELVRQRSFKQNISGVFEMIDPGTYRLRSVSDLNQNNKWDGGNYQSMAQPETVRYYTEPILVRANWEVEVEWIK